LYFAHRNRLQGVNDAPFYGFAEELHFQLSTSFFTLWRV
jgi:hypothetical protein